MDRNESLAHATTLGAYRVSCWKAIVDEEIEKYRFNIH